MQNLKINTTQLRLFPDVILIKLTLNKEMLNLNLINVSTSNLYKNNICIYIRSNYFYHHPVPFLSIHCPIFEESSDPLFPVFM